MCIWDLWPFPGAHMIVKIHLHAYFTSILYAFAVEKPGVILLFPVAVFMCNAALVYHENFLVELLVLHKDHLLVPSFTWKFDFMR